MFVFDLEKISESTGIEFETQDEAIEYLEAMRDYFRYHNKNLTAAQESFIMDFTCIIDAVEKF